jgi:hypothetical protein
MEAERQRKAEARAEAARLANEERKERSRKNFARPLQVSFPRLLTVLPSLLAHRSPGSPLQHKTQLVR